jgi:hypothetical protein
VYLGEHIALVWCHGIDNGVSFEHGKHDLVRPFLTDPKAGARGICDLCEYRITVNAVSVGNNVSVGAYDFVVTL